MNRRSIDNGWSREAKGFAAGELGMNGVAQKPRFLHEIGGSRTLPLQTTFLPLQHIARVPPSHPTRAKEAVSRPRPKQGSSIRNTNSIKRRPTIACTSPISPSGIKPTGTCPVLDPSICILEPSLSRYGKILKRHSSARESCKTLRLPVALCAARADESERSDSRRGGALDDSSLLVSPQDWTLDGCCLCCPIRNPLSTILGADDVV
ncbi:hypothetical protein M8818_000832 [Zalaria obscura]|uniref:Uncharacterized protein n=1 Tax=Zalaria obscura TaxID=2024903 RepID=A0ACC3SR42_9PEZI